VGVLTYHLLAIGGLPSDGAALLGVATIAALRFAAITWGLSLPEFTVGDEDAR